MLLSPDVLLSQIAARLESYAPFSHQLTAISKQVLFRTPSRISKDFPTIKLTITDANGHAFQTEALLDSGATSTYISKAFVEDHRIPTCALSHPVYAYNADDSLNSSPLVPKPLSLE